MVHVLLSPFMCCNGHSCVAIQDHVLLSPSMCCTRHSCDAIHSHVMLSPSMCCNTQSCVAIPPCMCYNTRSCDALQIHIMNFGPAAIFLGGVLEPPKPRAVSAAVEALQEVGALTMEEALTPLGEALLSFSKMQGSLRYHHFTKIRACLL
jgi:hypothetical protein